METSAFPLLAELLDAAGVSAGEEYDEADGEEVAGAEPEERPEVPDGEDPDDDGPPERPPGGEEPGDGRGDPGGGFEPF